MAAEKQEKTETGRTIESMSALFIASIQKRFSISDDELQGVYTHYQNPTAQSDIKTENAFGRAKSQFQLIKRSEQQVEGVIKGTIEDRAYRFKYIEQTDDHHFLVAYTEEDCPNQHYMFTVIFPANCDLKKYQAKELTLIKNQVSILFRDDLEDFLMNIVHENPTVESLNIVAELNRVIAQFIKTPDCSYIPTSDQIENSELAKTLPDIFREFVPTLATKLLVIELSQPTDGSRDRTVNLSDETIQKLIQEQMKKYAVGGENHGSLLLTVTTLKKALGQ